MTDRLPRQPLGPVASASASQRGWNDLAKEYTTSRGHHLGGPSGSGFLWGPEGLTEDLARLLGPPRAWQGRRVLEVGAGAGQCARWLAREHGADVVALDVSDRMLRSLPVHQAADTAAGSIALVQADAAALPLADASVDLVMTAHGALAFHGDLFPVLREIARVLSPQGRLVASVPHPMRWMFADDPARLEVVRSYFETVPYAEADDMNAITYVEHHHTLGHLLSAWIAAGFVLERFHEPRWHHLTAADYGGWSAATLAMAPRTLILSARLA